jgi:hypothetical protein
MAQTQHNPLVLPADLPVPQDDGAAAHLIDARLPDLSLPATDASTVNLGRLTGRTVVYIYPRTGRPGQAPPRSRVRAAALRSPAASGTILRS